jgi:uncharacterized protein DUF5681
LLFNNFRVWQRGTPFQKGQSGNPSGKAPGARNKTTMLAEKLMQDDAREIVKVVLDAAKRGNINAARLILERIAPIRKGRPVYLDLPPMQTAGDIAAAMAALTDAMASGDVTPDEAVTVASVFETRSKVCAWRRSKRRFKNKNEERHREAACPTRSQIAQESGQKS